MKFNNFKRISALLSAVVISYVSLCCQTVRAEGEYYLIDEPYNYDYPYNPGLVNGDTNDYGNEQPTESMDYTDSPEVTTEGFSGDDEAEPTTAEPQAPVQQTKRKKASINEYDSSMSSVSYEFSYPEYTYDEDFTNYKSDQQYDEDKKNMIVSFRKGNPFTSVRRNAGADVSQIGHVGEIPVSNNQEITSDTSGEFTFVTYGYGHGVGMSQNGANFYAEYAGWSYQDILAHYYPKTNLMNTGLTDYEQLTIGGEYVGDTLTVVSQIVNNEIGGSMNYEAIKAQAVAVYTYIKYHGDDSADLKGLANPPDIVVQACAEVLGEALYYNNNYALTMFSKSSGGCTANCGEVFYADIPYLVSVASEFDREYDSNYGVITYYPASEVKRLIEGEYKITLSDDPAKWIQPSYSAQTGYVTDVNVDDQISIRGYELKLLLNLNSSKFNISYTY